MILVENIKSPQACARKWLEAGWRVGARNWGDLSARVCLRVSWEC